MLPGRKYTPQDVLDVARRRGWLVVVAAVVCVFGALVVSSSVRNRYRSEMLIQIVPQRVPDAYVRSTVTIRTEDRLEALSQQVMSRTQLERMVAEYELYPRERARSPLQDVVDRMRADIELELVRERRNDPADAFYIRFTYDEPRMAMRVTDRLGTLFVDQNARDRGALADATSMFLDSQMAEARARLEAQEQRLERFRQQNRGRLPSQLDFNMQAIQSTQLQLQALVESLARDRDRKLMLERLHADAAKEPVLVAPTQAPAQPPDPTLGTGLTAQQQLAAARAALTRLELRLRPEHPDVIRTKRLIAELEPKAKAEGAGREPDTQVAVSPEEAQRRERLRQMAAEIESLDRQIGFKESEERRLRGSIADYQQRIEAVPGIESAWVSLTRDYETLQQTYQELLTKSEQSKMAADLERRQIGEQFRILDPARVPTRPTSPSRLQINAIGLALGLFLGLAVVALLEITDSTFRSEADVLNALALPVVALVPYVSTVADAKRRRLRWTLTAAAVGTAVIAGAFVFWSMQLWKFVA
jgi:polysaccharide chain length determinant protein (PEP-CTERM system associated)